jgi:hypothetical protein
MGLAPPTMILEPPTMVLEPPTMGLAALTMILALFTMRLKYNIESLYEAITVPSNHFLSISKLISYYKYIFSR